VTKRSVAILVTLGAATACATPFYEELHDDAARKASPVADTAPTLAYELIVIAANDSVGRLNGPETFGERVGRELDELLRERGVQPARLHAAPVAGDWLRFTLTRGRKQIRLKAEHWKGDRLVLTDDYATPAKNVRADVGRLLDRIVSSVARDPAR
jgi:hypothetical protein